jgi:multidrug efflux system membrane fusion protein
MLALLLLIAAAAGGWWWWSSRAPADAANAASGGAAGGPAGPGGRRFGGANNRVQPVSVQTVRRQDIRVMLNAIGSISASNTATVRPQVSGVLQAIQFSEGQQVRAGQQLALIDPRAFQAALGQAEGALARDRAALDNARIDLLRYRDLFAKDAVAKQQLDTQEALVRQLEGTIRADQAGVDSARLQLSYTRVLAPIPGKVGLKQADLGNVVAPGDANGLVTITQTRPIALVFSAPSAQLPQIDAKLRGRQILKVEAWDRGGARRLAEGRVATIDNAIDAATDSIKLKALFANEDDTLFPNQAVSVRLQLDTLVDTLAVPPAAVLRGAQDFYVYVVNADNSVSTRSVKPGVVDGDWMAVEGKLEAGERVVIDGVDRLRDGAKVEVIAADPKQRTGATAQGGGRRGARGPGAAASGAASRPASSDPAASSAPAGLVADERPRWLDRLPPDVQDKVMKMSPAEREAWIAERRAERAKREAAASGGAN